ncbi:hypothetical protein GCM10027515_11980 [Schumannella luteola]|uniref:Uncharacterized protein n=1 Tax=Schumannella luteola TaxID=472059 RepID=A0A852Y411_9MICO|nr:hypothetical protein [Schumannella luteola]NYG97646.1 hypothetical protein [Schumannella luteola]TPX04696.1 hypothetical protein FJ656_10665 [Schumannella luteola]
MKALRGVLTLLTVLGGLVTVSFTVNSLNPRAFGWLPDAVHGFMSDYDWVRWVAAGVLVLSVLLNLALESASKRAVDAGEQRR